LKHINFTGKMQKEKKEKKSCNPKGGLKPP
jgi:hypothetical protein